MSVQSARHVRSAAALAVLSMLMTSPALAGATCSVAATGVAFGAYDVSVPTPNDSTGTVTVTCSYVPPGGTTDVSIQTALSAGNSGSYSPRQMAAGAARLNYNLFLNIARSTVWGNGLAGTGIATATLRVGPGAGNGTRSADLPVYGRIPALQGVGLGNYSDVIVVTVTF